MFKTLLAFIAPHQKAIVAGGVTLVLGALAILSITPEMTVGQAVAIIVGAIYNAVFVWLVPNQPKP